MKTKTINSVINKKFDEWLASIEDQSVRKLVEKGSILTGGAIASMLLRIDVNDFDFYFKDKATAVAVAKYYVDRFKTGNKPEFEGGQQIKIYVVETDDHVKIVVKSAGVAGEDGKPGEEKTVYNYFESREPEAAEDYAEKVIAKKKDLEEKPDYRPVFMSANAISLSGDIQMVIRFYGSPEEIHENYDFVHATNYWTSWDRKLVLREAALECLLTKELRYVGSKYPICSLVRARKFIQREWTINAGQILKICFQINELDLKNFAVLEEQLCGMDVAYFSQVLHSLKDKDPEKINTTYLVEIIDRIFG